MTVRQSSASLEYIRVGPVAATANGVAVNVSTDVVKMAFLTTGTPAAGDWKSANWETGGPPYFAVSLVAGAGVVSPPGGATVLAAGTYVVWLKITDSPEIPARPVDALVVY